MTEEPTDRLKAYGVGMTIETMIRDESFIELDQLLQETQREALKFGDRELLMCVRATYRVSNHLPTWQPLLNTVHQIFVTRNGEERATSLLAGLIPQRSGTILKNTGNLPR